MTRRIGIPIPYWALGVLWSIVTGTFCCGAVPSEDCEVYVAIIQQYGDSTVLSDTAATFLVSGQTTSDLLDSAALRWVVDSGGGLSVQSLRRTGFRNVRAHDPIDDSTIVQLVGDSVAIELIRAFSSLNAKSYSFNLQVPAPFHSQMISQEQFRALGDSARHAQTDVYYWLGMRFARFGGYWDFSRIAYSKSGEYALVFAGHRYTGLNGKGRLLLLRKLGGTWQIIKEELRWIS